MILLPKSISDGSRTINVFSAISINHSDKPLCDSFSGLSQYCINRFLEFLLLNTCIRLLRLLLAQKILNLTLPSALKQIHSQKTQNSMHTIANPGLNRLYSRIKNHNGELYTIVMSIPWPLVINRTFKNTCNVLRKNITSSRRWQSYANIQPPFCQFGADNKSLPSCQQ